MRLIVRFFFDGANVDSIPADVRTQLKANLREWQALALSGDAFPSLGRDEVAGLSALLAWLALSALFAWLAFAALLAESAV